MIKLIILAGGRYSSPFDSAFFASNQVLYIFFITAITFLIIVAYLILKSKIHQRKMNFANTYKSGEFIIETVCNDNRMCIVIKDIKTDEQIFTLFSDIFNKTEGWITITNSADINENFKIPVVKYSLERFIELAKIKGFKEINAEIDLYEMYDMKALESFYKEHQFNIEFYNKDYLAKAKHMIQS